MIFAAERTEESSSPLPRGAGEAVSEEVSRRKLLQVVLVSPQVPLVLQMFSKTSASGFIFVSVSLYNPNCSFFFF